MSTQISIFLTAAWEGKPAQDDDSKRETMHIFWRLDYPENINKTQTDVQQTPHQLADLLDYCGTIVPLPTQSKIPHSSYRVTCCSQKLAIPYT